MKLTERKYRQIVEEKEKLKKKIRKISKANGKKRVKSDSTNTELRIYQEELANLKRKVREKEIILEEAEVIACQKNDVVQIGSRIAISFGDKKKKYEYVVGVSDSDSCTTSLETPLGRAVIGKRAGDEFTYKHEGKKFKVKLLDII